VGAIPRKRTQQLEEEIIVHLGEEVPILGEHRSGERGPLLLFHTSGGRKLVRCCGKVWVKYLLGGGGGGAGPVSD